MAKIKPPMPIFDEEIEKNIIQKNQSLPVRRPIDYPKADLYDTDADWNDKSFDSTSNKVLRKNYFTDVKKPLLNINSTKK